MIGLQPEAYVERNLVYKFKNSKSISIDNEIFDTAVVRY